MATEDEELQGSSPERDGLLRFLAFIGIAGAAAAGAGVILRAIPEARLDAFKKVIASRAGPAIDRILKHPVFRKLDQSILANPAGVHNPVVEQIFREVDVEDLGIVDMLKNVLRAGDVGAENQDAIKKFILQQELDIPEHVDGAWRRMIVNDLHKITKQPGALPKGVDVTGIDFNRLGSVTGINADRIQGMRLSPWLYYNESTNEIRNLGKLHPGRMFEKLQQQTIMGIPFFRVLPSKRAAGYKMALFGQPINPKSVLGAEDPDYVKHPLAMLLAGKPGQVQVLDGEAWFRQFSNEPFKRLGVKGLRLTSDFRSGEMAFRGMTTNKQFDELYLGKSVGGIRGLVGIGPEYLPPTLRGVFADVGRKGYVEEGHNVFDKAIRWAASKAASVVGASGGIDSEIKHPRIDTFSRIFQGGLFVERKGAAGLMDYVNAQVSRPFYMLNRFGFGIRPGRNPLTTLGKISALAMGAYMGKEFLSYADWATGNVVSTGAGKLLGGANWLRQRSLEAVGLRQRLSDQEKETPGLVNSPLSKAMRLAGFGFAGAGIGRTTESALAGNLLQKLAGSGRWGSEVAKGMVGNIGAGKAGGGLLGGLIGIGLGLATMGDLTEKSSSVAEKLRGERQVPYRASSGWMLGRDPYSGGRIRYHRPSLYQTAGTDFESIGVYGSEGNKWRYGSWLPTMQNWGGLRRLFNPYYAEDRNRNTRPYPATSGHFGEVPIFGPALQSTVGSLLKPTVYRGQSDLASINEGTKIQAMQAAAGGPGATLPGGIPAAAPNSLATGGGRFIRNIEEYVGLRGFQTQFLAQQLGLPTSPTQAILAESGKMTSLARSYYDREPGGMLGMTELLRRFVIRPSTQPTINTLPNSMPRWLAGSRSMFEKDRAYFRDLTLGDPYTTVPMGEARLPGPGRDSIYPLHGGGTYSVVDAFLVVADVQPFTQSYQILKIEVERLIRQGKLPPEWIRRYQIAVEQAETRASFRVFHSNRYKRDAQLTVEKVLSATRFTAREHPGKIFSLEGTLLDYSEPIKLLASRQAAGMSPDQARQSVAADRARLERLLREREGRSIAVQMTGSNRVMIPELQGDIRAMGVEEESDLYEQGFVGKMWTAAGKKLGRLGAVGGAVLGLIAGARRGIGIAQAGSKGGLIGGAVIGAALGGITGGWLQNKFTGDYTAVEHYERFQKYGSPFADWMSPYQSFIRPWALTAASNVADFTPLHRARQYETEEYFDKLKFLKYQRLAEQAQDDTAASFFQQQAAGTMTGLDMSKLTSSTPAIQTAIPANERQYFKQFAAEQSPEVRQRIVGAVPDYMKAVYLSIWQNEGGLGSADLESAYNKHVQPRMAAPVDQAREYFANHVLPDSGWSGWEDDINIQDVKYKTIQFSGASVHDHGLFSTQGARIDAFSPQAGEAARFLGNLPSRRMRIPPMALQRAFGLGPRVHIDRDYTRIRTNQAWLEQDDTNRAVAAAVAEPGLY